MKPIIVLSCFCLVFFTLSSLTIRAGCYARAYNCLEGCIVDHVNSTLPPGGTATCVGYPNKAVCSIFYSDGSLFDKQTVYCPGFEPNPDNPGGGLPDAICFLYPILCSGGGSAL